MANIAVQLYLLLVSSICVMSADFPNLNKLRDKTSPETQTQAAKDLISRVIGQRSDDFIVLIDTTLGPDGKDTFQLGSQGSQIEISGTTGVAVSMGFYYYLKYFCNAQKTWAGQQMHLPSVLPPVLPPVKITTNDRFRYYQNVCTLSYTMAFWDWTRWQQEIDWMAMRGINLPLAFIGQEAIFQRVYLNLGFNQTDLDAHFGGPAFLAWARMGNIHGWGGPLPQMWITQKLVLQHRILDRMRSLGMTPVLPAFAGHVPAAITRVFPHANVTRLGLWAHFNTSYSATYLLDFNDPLFKKIGSDFIQALTNEFGTDHIYNADTFNEMDPSSSEPAYLASAGKAVFKGMTTADPEAIWLMQGWLFAASGFWGPSEVKALVTSIPQGRMIILDLVAERIPVYWKFESFYGQPFIWCMLHNFGGTMELFGNLENIGKAPFAGRAFPNSTMIGVGMTPEGIHQNEVMYEFMSEHAWRPKPWDIKQWLNNYAQQRYGLLDPVLSKAWQYLKASVYNVTDHHPDHDYVLITMRPTPNYNVSKDVWYNPDYLFKAWDLFIQMSPYLEGMELFTYDLVDVTRNSLQLIALPFYTSIIDGYKSNDTALIDNGGKKLCDLLDEMDSLLSSNDRFLVGKWIADAISWGTDNSEKNLYQYNARNQITMWGPNGEIHDYASKQWAGVTKDFYKPRIQFFTNWLKELLANGTRWNSYIFNEKIMAAIETPWTWSTKSYPIIPSGNPHHIATALHSKYRPTMDSSIFSKLAALRLKQTVDQERGLMHKRYY